LTEAAITHKFTPSETGPKGLVQVITGDGKGKTSAALGAVVRAVGHGLRVAVIIFMKGDYPYGEWSVLSGLPKVKIFRFGFRTFTDPRNVKPEEKEQARQAMDAARTAVMGGNFDLVILDEINVVTAWKLAGLDEVIEIIHEKPANVELILTGRYADKQLIDLADMVTECVKIKHPYDKGIGARAGFDY
jgi:cob(I)alamin adenosyltransferase